MKQEKFDDEFFDAALQNFEQRGAVYGLAHAYQFCCFVLSFFTAELCTFHNSLGPKTQAENSNVLLRSGWQWEASWKVGSPGVGKLADNCFDMIRERTKEAATR